MTTSLESGVIEAHRDRFSFMTASRARLRLSSALCSLGVLMAMGAAPALADCVVSGTTTLTNCDTTEVTVSMTPGTGTLTVTDEITTFIGYASPTTPGVYNQTVTLTGSTTANNPTYSALIMQFGTDGGTPPQIIDVTVNATVNITEYVAMSSHGGFGAVWVRNDNAGTVNIESAGSITASFDNNTGLDGAISGVSNKDRVEIINHGSVVSINSRGLYADGKADEITGEGASATNSATGSVTAYTAAIRAISYLGLAKIENAGMVESTLFQGLIAWSSSGPATILNSGSVTSGNDNAIYAATQNGKAIVTNSGTVIAQGDTALDFTHATYSVAQGYSGLRASVYTTGDIEITNDADGSVTAERDSGILAQTPDGNVTVTNRGTITSKTGIVVNSGLGTGRTGATVSAISGNASVSNAGTVNATDIAVAIDATENELTNTGTIITTDVTAVVTGNGNSVIANYGTISAASANDTAISMGTGTNRLILGDSATLVGKVVSAGADTTLELAGSATGNIDLGQIGSTGQFQGFSKLEKSGEGLWNVTGTSSSLINSMFVSGGTLALTGALGSDASVLTVAGGVLEVNSGGELDSYTNVIGNADAGGSVKINGTGSIWRSNNSVEIGLRGTSGSLIVENGGTFETYEGSVQFGAGGTLVVAGAESRVDIGSRTHEPADWVAAAGYLSLNEGNATISGGASLIDDGGYIGGNGSTWAEMLVTGQGTTWHNELNVYVGGNGNGVVGYGRLNIEDGASVTGYTGAVGVDTGSFGELLLTGTGSKLEIMSRTGFSGNMRVGFNGDGKVTVQNGALLANANQLDIATNTGSTGVLAIGGGVGETAAAPGTISSGNGIFFGGGNGTLAFNHTATNYLFDQKISGANGQILHLAGNTTFAGDGSEYEGSTAISGGKLTVTGVLGGNISVDMGGTLQIGDGETTGNVLGNIVNNSALIFHRSDTYDFPGTISGNGSVTILGGMVNFEQAGGYNGDITVAGSELVLRDGAVSASNFRIAASGSISGSGTVGGLIVETGGAIAPGYSPGTITVTGNYQQEAGSIYQVEVVPGLAVSDHVIVGGTAILEEGALLNVSKYGAGAYAKGTRYTVLTASGGVDGTYTLTGDTTLYGFYGLIATYDGNNVYLEVGQSQTFGEVAQTPNQIAAAGGLQSLPTDNTLRDALASMNDISDAPAAMDQLSGEVYASAKTILLENSRFVRDAAIERMRAAFGSVGAAPAPAYAHSASGSGDIVQAPANFDGLEFWANGYGAWGDADGNANVASLKHDIAGFVGGADVAAFDNWRFGLFGGYGRATYEVQDRASSGDSENYSLGLYGAAQWDRIGLRFGGAHTWSSLATQRAVSFAGFSDSLTADYKVATSQLFADAGYRIDTPVVSFEPFTGLAYVNVDGRPFAEEGGSAALSGGGEDSDLLFSSIGVRVSRPFSVGDLEFTATGAAGWRHSWGDVTPKAELSFPRSDLFAISGAPLARDTAFIDAGFSTPLSEKVVVGVSYSGQFGDGQESQGIRGKLNLRF